MPAGAWALAGILLWLASLGSLAAVWPAELIAAAVAGVLAARVAGLGRRALAGTGGRDGRRQALPPAVWRTLPRLPITVLTDTGRILAQAARGGLTGETRILDLAAAGSGSDAARRRAAATMLLGVTPGTYVTDVDQNTGTLTIHALVPPSGVERALARPTQGGPGDGPTEDERRESR